MAESMSAPQRYIGLDVHKHYLVAVGVTPDRKRVLGPQRVELRHLERWIAKTLTEQDAVVLEMTGNSYQIYDELQPHVYAVTVVHPPHVKLVTEMPVMNDKIAAGQLAELHAAGWLKGIWVPPQEVRELRALIAQRSKMVKLATQAKNRLHAVLHRYHLAPPEGDLFSAARRSWWTSLKLTPVERVRIECDLRTLECAQEQIAQIEVLLKGLAAQDERVPYLVQLPGVGLLTAMTLLAAIGDIARFPTAKRLVGYAGLGARLHDSGMTTRRGRITKAGRRDLRSALVESAHSAASTHPHWKAELARLEPRLGHNKAIVAIARKLLVAIWHVLTERCADRFAEPELLARKLYGVVVQFTRRHRPEGQTAAARTHQLLAQLGCGADLATVHCGSKTIHLLPRDPGPDHL
ncbi:MAG: IS110 family transposase [Anaerolineae bacterium]|nr:IS110 family transposase [Anaerolineae bacterium]